MTGFSLTISALAVTTIGSFLPFLYAFYTLFIRIEHTATNVANLFGFVRWLFAISHPADLKCLNNRSIDQLNLL